MQSQEGEGPCSICGGDSWKNVMATCSVCKTIRVHRYCMKVIRTDVPNDWVCEECTTGTGSDRGEVGQGFSQRVQHNAVTPTARTNVCNESSMTKRFNAVKLGKTKFLSEDEVKKLQSGSIKVPCSKHKIAGTASSPPVSPNFFPSRVKPIPRMIRPGSIEASHNGKMQVPDTRQPRTFEDEKLPVREQQKAFAVGSGCKGEQTISVRPSSEVKIGKLNAGAEEGDIYSASVDKTKNRALLYSSSASRHRVPISKRKVCASDMKELSHDKCNISLPVKEVRFTYADDQNVAKEAPPMNPPSSFCSPESNSDAVAGTENFGIEICDLLDVLPEIRLYRDYAPALQPVWNGGFNLKDFDKAAKFYEGFRAHPPMKVHRKAYEFSQKIPLVIQVKLLHRNDVWAHLFQNGDPQFDDIALYFFPSDNDQRSKETHASLVNLLEIRDSVMLSFMDGVELLILTSKQFDVKLLDAITRSGVNQFLWGIFLDGDNQIENAIHELTSLPAPSNGGENSNDTDGSCGNEIDMEIDVVGGQELGNLSRKPTGEDCKDSNKKVADQNALKEMETKNNAFNDLKSPIQQACKETKQGHISHKVFQKVSTDLITLRHYSANRLSKGAVEQTTFDERVVQPVTPENASQQKMKAEKAPHQSFGLEVKREPQELDSGTNSLTRWCPPPTDWVKLNVAASSEDPAGAGGVIRNHSGKWVVGYTKNVGAEKGLGAVFWAVLEGLRLAWNKGFRKVILECESDVVIELLTRSPDVLDIDSSLIERCIEFTQLQWECKVERVSQAANLCANRLATSFGPLPMQLIVLDTPPHANIVSLL